MNYAINAVRASSLLRTLIKDAYALREPTPPYTANFKPEKACLSAENMYFGLSYEYNQWVA
jgi:hypothetical protein